MEILNSLVLAYIGDCVYELNIRKKMIESNITKANELQTNAKRYVSAKNQACFLKKMIDDCFFDEQEIDIIKRARNTKVNSHPKNTDILTYKHATALEAVIGFHFLQENHNRIEEIMKYIYEEIK